MMSDKTFDKLCGAVKTDIFRYKVPKDRLYEGLELWHDLGCFITQCPHIVVKDVDTILIYFRNIHEGKSVKPLYFTTLCDCVFDWYRLGVYILNQKGVNRFMFESMLDLQEYFLTNLEVH